ncbi:hypothetical protein JKY79_01635 [Candidatus Babeliales bacterium]|nr:hypothetical protein [Candidatus Babeliales bacterium]
MQANKKNKLLFLFFILCYFSTSKSNTTLVFRAGLESSNQFCGYDECRDIVPLGDIIFDDSCKNEEHKSLQLKDIYLPSKVASQGKITLAGPPTIFGIKTEHYYLAALADTSLNWQASIHDQRLLLEGGCYFTQEHEWLPSLYYFGFSIPFIKKSHSLLLENLGGKIAFSAGSFVGIESTIQQFFSDANIDFLDFFNRYVLIPKNLTYVPHDESIGFGDLLLIGILDWGGKWNGIEALQASLRVTCPTGKRESYDQLWPNHLGHGAWALDCQFSLQIHTKEIFYNPFLHCSLKLYAPFSEERRVPQLATTFLDGTLPSRYSMHTIADFSEYDSTVNAFADSMFPMYLYRGIEFSTLIGNSLYLHKDKFKIGLFYKGCFTEAIKYRLVNKLNEEKKRISNASYSHKMMVHLSYAPSDNIQYSSYISQQVSGKLTGREFLCGLSVVFKI